ncbi:hypothetical protein Tco_0594803 [Tanacetum coccineum]
MERGFLSKKKSGRRRGVKEKDLNRNLKNTSLGIGVFTDSDDTINADTPRGVVSAVHEGVTPFVVDMMGEEEKQNSLDDNAVLESFSPLSTPVTTEAWCAGDKNTVKKPSKKLLENVWWHTLWLLTMLETLGVNKGLVAQCSARLLDYSPFNLASNPFDVLNSVDNDVEFGTNGRITKLVHNEATLSGSSFINVNNDGEFGSNTPIGEKIDKIERQICEVIMESLVKKKQKGAILELKRRHLKKVLKQHQYAVSRKKIQRIRASSSQERVLINS